MPENTVERHDFEGHVIWKNAAQYNPPKDTTPERVLCYLITLNDGAGMLQTSGLVVPRPGSQRGDLMMDLLAWARIQNGNKPAVAVFFHLAENETY